SFSTGGHMTSRPSSVTAAMALALCAAMSAASDAAAQEAADFGQILARMKSLEARVATVTSLEARVAALEGENRQARREAAEARAEAQALKQKLSPKTTAGPAAAAGLAVSQSYAMVTKGPVAPPVPSWGGFYAGAAFGLGSLHTRVGENSHDTSTQ